MTNQPDLDTPSLSYEQCRDELERIVAALEQGGHDLDTSIQLWEKGEQLAQWAYEYLTQAQNKVNDALQRSDAATPSANEDLLD